MRPIIPALMRSPIGKYWDVPHSAPYQACRAAGCLLVVALLSSCAASSPVATHATPTTTATPALSTATAGSAPSPPTVVWPAPFLKPLAAPPQNCAITPPPQQLSADQAQLQNPLVGGGEFWIDQVFYSNVIHLGQTGPNRLPNWKWVVEVGPNYAQPVTLQLRDLRTGTTAWWSNNASAMPVLVLDPHMDNSFQGPLPPPVSGAPDDPHGGGAPYNPYFEWGVFPTFEVAGCYRLSVSWAGGSWQSIFAVGS
jgi:hypothetical protein